MGIGWITPELQIGPWRFDPGPSAIGPVVRQGWVRADEHLILLYHLMRPLGQRLRAGLVAEAPVSSRDPVDDEAAVFLGCFLPGEVAGVEGMAFAVW